MNIAIIVVFVLAFGLLVSSPVQSSRNWSSTVTPLASIIGSGFLVSVPLFASAVGIWAVTAVAVLTLFAFLIGGAIRYNIRHGEQIFETAEPGHTIRSVETLSHLVLAGAYFISVAYYLVLLAEFSMRLLGVAEPLIGKTIATLIVAGICAIGSSRGLGGVQRAEKFTVSANLAAISALLVALFIFGSHLPAGFSWSAEAREQHAIDWNTVRFLMGLLIIVQGFETTRFMGHLYDAETRIAAMKRSQILSSLIYIVFFLLMIPLFPLFTSTADVAGFIGMIGRVSPWLPYVVTAGAIASQFSAAVADSIGASGLVTETTHEHVNARHSYVLIGLVAILVIWATDVVAIVALASRAFALFYALQCTVAVLVARHRRESGKAIAFGTLAAMTYAIAIMGIPAGA